MVTVSVAQISVAQSDVKRNLEKGAYFIKEAARRGSDIICFPEMWTTGFQFTKNKMICGEQDKTLQEIQALCREHKIWHSGSILQQNGEGKPTNTHVLINSQGEVVGRYSKVHLFSFMDEDKYVAPGEHLEVVETSFAKAGLSVCYDIRFGELFKSYALQGCTMIFSPMAFPYPRLEHWKVLVRARAIENQLFMIGANQIGKENFSSFGLGEVTYFGHSCIIDPYGKMVIEAGDEVEVLLTAELVPEVADSLRKAMHVLKDRRPALYQLD